jgi:hypothetical protein
MIQFASCAGGPRRNEQSRSCGRSAILPGGVGVNAGSYTTVLGSALRSRPVFLIPPVETAVGVIAEPQMVGTATIGIPVSARSLYVRWSSLRQSPRSSPSSCLAVSAPPGRFRSAYITASAWVRNHIAADGRLLRRHRCSGVEMMARRAKPLTSLQACQRTDPRDHPCRRLIMTNERMACGKRYHRKINLMSESYLSALADPGPFKCERRVVGFRAGVDL